MYDTGCQSYLEFSVQSSLRRISYPTALAKETNTLIMFEISHSNDWKFSDRT